MATKPVWTLAQITENFFRSSSEWDEDIATLTFSFPSTRPSGYSGDSGEGEGFLPFTSVQRTWAASAIQLWADVVDIDFVNAGAGGGGDLRFMNTEGDFPGTAHAKGGSKLGDIWVHWSKPSNQNLDYGTRAVKTLIHEIGHALGLQHPGEYDASDAEAPTYAEDAEYYQDSNQYTLMSYFNASNTGTSQPASPQTPMLHDIWAVQQRYGANMTTRTGDTVYGYDSNAGNPVYDFTVNKKPVLCIWDAGGTDELNLSGGQADQKINLSPGTFTSSNGGVNNISIAYNCWIENAYAGHGDDDVLGNSLSNRLRGGDGDDTLRGYAGADSLQGGAGDDYLAGSTGIDKFDGGAGLDVVSYSYSGKAWLVDLAPGSGPAFAQTSDATETFVSVEGVDMGSGNDTLRGSNDDNVLKAGGGNDRLYGYLGNDTLEGGAGDDMIYRRDGNNLIDGGDGIDLLNYGGTTHAIKLRLDYPFEGQKVVDLAGGANDQTDRVIGIEKLIATGYDDTITAGVTGSTIDGGNGDDDLSGGGGNDSLFGGYGDDTLAGDAGNDTINGGIAIDIASYATRFQAVTVDLAITGSQNTGGGGLDLLIGIEGLIGTDYADTLNGTAGFNRFTGGAGSDRIDGRGGNDFMSCGDGNDTVSGGSGNDTIYGDGGHDVLTGGSGDDYLGGFDGADTVNYAGAAGFVRVDLAVAGPQQVGLTEGSDTLVEIENAVGSGFGDVLRGTEGTNKLYGLGGNDLIEGRGGNDILDGGMGSDTASYESAASGVTADLSNALPQNTGAGGVDSFISIENLEGSNFADILTGDVQDNYLIGNAGDDWLLGGEGKDWLGGGAGDDILFGGAGDDLVTGGDGLDTASYLFASAAVQVALGTTAAQATGGAGTDRLYFIENLAGSAFGDTLDGSAQANAIAGFGGNDTITGLAGQDTLTGGAGSDVFTFTAVSHSGKTNGSADIIADFTQGEDVIDLSGIDAKPNTAAENAFVFVGTESFGGIGRIRYVQHEADGFTTVLLNTVSGGGAEMAIRLNGVLTLTENDFVL